MSSVSATTVPPLAHTGKVTQARVFLSEWTKLRSVRSTRWSLLAAVGFTIGIAALACAVVSHHWPHMSLQERADFHPLDPNLAGVQLAQLALGVLGVLVITAEYSTGMIRASMTAGPRRLPVLWGKAVVYGLVTLILMVPSTLIAFVVGEWIFSAGTSTSPSRIRELLARSSVRPSISRSWGCSAWASARSCGTQQVELPRSRD